MKTKKYSIYQYGAKAACTSLPFHGEFSDCSQCVIGELQFDIVFGQQLFVLFDCGIFRFTQNAHQHLNTQTVEWHQNRKAPNEFLKIQTKQKINIGSIFENLLTFFCTYGNHSKFDQITNFHIAKCSFITFTLVECPQRLFV